MIGTCAAFFTAFTASVFLGAAVNFGIWYYVLAAGICTALAVMETAFANLTE